MTESNHLVLSTIIKKVHEELRTQYHLFGEDAAWKKHCSDEDKLKKYATAMKVLSSTYWESNFMKKSKPVSRIAWTSVTCITYFTESIEQFRQKEYSVINKFSIPVDIQIESNLSNHKWKLLDVGSCYNPFKVFDNFEIMPIDISPATDEVYKCDFLNVNIGSQEIIESIMVTSLKKNSFDIVVFSLLLEYFPSPKQRLECCQRAYELLKSEGLLIIITPDSNHVGVNAKLMKSWRFILAEIGFFRIKYEKLPHIHCMAFRKSFNKEITLNWTRLYKREQTYNEIYIPQDFIKKSILNDVPLKDSGNPMETTELFLELPGGG